MPSRGSRRVAPPTARFSTAGVAGSPVDPAMAREHALDVAVEDRAALARRERRDRRRGRAADAGQRRERRGVARERRRRSARRPRALRRAGGAPGGSSRGRSTARAPRPRSPAASARTSGNAATKRSKYASTVATCVCCSMISDTQIRYGSRVRCHGRSCRPWTRCQATIRRECALITLVGQACSLERDRQAEAGRQRATVAAIARPAAAAPSPPPRTSGTSR